VKVLILKPSSLGDIIHALPVLRLIKQQRPEWKVHWWIEKDFAPLLEMDRDISALHYFERHALRSFSGVARGINSVERMRAERFDVVVDLQGLARSALHGWVVHGGYVIGLDQRREGAALLYDMLIPRPSSRTHAVDWCLEVLPGIGLSADEPFEWLPERHWVTNQLCGQGYQSNVRWIGLCPGARWKSKQWPVESFEALVKELDYPDVRFAVFGGKDDRVIGRRLAANEHVVDLTGRTSLPETIEWMRVCSAVVTNDTGPMHIAAALNIPVVALFGPTDPLKTGPYRAKGRVVCQEYGQCDQCVNGRSYRADGHDCMKSIDPNVVAAAVIECE